MPLNKFLTVDPGEDTGWSVWQGEDLVDAGTTKMWEFSDAVWAAALYDNGFERQRDLLTDDLEQVTASVVGIDRVVCENWTLYPWEAMAGNLNWDECRTARLIGSLQAAARFADWTWELQAAKIKERAVAAGAESYYYHPLRENRHLNDALQHGVYRNAVERGEPWVDLSKKTW